MPAPQRKDRGWGILHHRPHLPQGVRHLGGSHQAPCPVPGPFLPTPSSTAGGLSAATLLQLPALAPEEEPLSGTPHLSFLWFVPSHPPVTCRERQEIVGVPRVRKCLLSPWLVAARQGDVVLGPFRFQGSPHALPTVPPVAVPFPLPLPATSVTPLSPFPSRVLRLGSQVSSKRVFVFVFFWPDS